MQFGAREPRIFVQDQYENTLRDMEEWSNFHSKWYWQGRASPVENLLWPATPKAPSVIPLLKKVLNYEQLFSKINIDIVESYHFQKIDH